MTTRPNILWLCTDQQRWDTIAALGNTSVRTPHVDSLVNDGVAFTNAFCQSTVCSPSRASFLTGRYPRTTGCRQNGQTLPERETLISRIFADAGYVCGLSGKLHLASCSDGKVEVRGDDGYSEFQWSHHPPPDWEENAYSQWLKAKGTSWEEIYNGPTTGYVKDGVPAALHQTTWCTEVAVDFIKRHRDEPWFFSWNPFDPHHPFDPPPEYLARYHPDDMPLPSYQPGELDDKTPYQQLDHEWAHNSPGEFHVGGMTDDDRRAVTAAYYAMIELVDDQVGRMLAALAETDQARDTLVIFMSDHGEMLGDHGLYFKGPHFYEGAIRIPLVMRYPDQFSKGEVVDDLTELLDLAPTLCDAAGIDIPAGMQGYSLVPQLTGQSEKGTIRDSVFCEYYNSWTHPRSYGSMLRTDRYKICVYHGIEEGELYDLETDPHEFTNLWNSADHADLKQQMLKDAFDASVFTMDPLPPRLGPF
jgi:arylsulfatase A-like enzyme